MTLNGLMVDFICLGGAVILTAAGMGVVLLLTEDRRGRIVAREFPAAYRRLVRDPGGDARTWVRSMGMHAKSPAALQLARHIGGLGHLLPKVSPWRATMLARNLTARATRAHKPAVQPEDPYPVVMAGLRHRYGTLGDTGPAPSGQNLKLPVPGAGVLPETPSPVTTATCPGADMPPKVDSPAPGKTGPPRDQPAPVPVASPPAAAGSVISPESPPPLPGLPPEIPAPDCDYPDSGPFADWLRDSFVGGIAAVK